MGGHVRLGAPTARRWSHLVVSCRIRAISGPASRPDQPPTKRKGHNADTKARKGSVARFPRRIAQAPLDEMRARVVTTTLSRVIPEPKPGERIERDVFTGLNIP